MTKYWFYLHPSVYIVIKDNILLYDTYGNRMLIIYDKSLRKVFEDILDIANMGVVLLDDIMASNEIIKKIISDKWGVLVSNEAIHEKPAMLPLEHSVNIDFDRDFDGNLYEYLLSKDISKYLLDLSIILNIGLESNCSKYYTPNSSFVGILPKSIIANSIIESIVEQIEYFPIYRIRIIADQIKSRYATDITSVIEKMHRINKCVVLSVNIEDFDLEKYNDNIEYEIIVDSYINIERINNLINNLKENSSYRFIIRNEKEYENALKLIENNNIDNYILYPYFDGTNNMFLSSVLSQDKNDIFSRPISMKEIFRNTKLNSNFLGKMIIDPNGYVYTDYSGTRIGNISTHKILDCIIEEVKSKISWRFTRNFPKCTKCLFQYLCPPPSSYERNLDITDKCEAFNS